MGNDAHAALVRAELDRILASEVFKRSGRLSSFLKFIVERTLAGDGDSLKEHVIAIELYGKATDFDAAIDPIVRVDARRLRDRLREYYAAAGQDPVVISVPKGSYTPFFQLMADPALVGGMRPRTPDVPAAATTRTGSSRLWWLAAVLLVVIGSAAWGLTRVRRGDQSEQVRLLTATSLAGGEENPSLSPDGNFVAFSWGGGAPDASHDIWIKAVEGDVLRNVTNTPDVLEKYPQWSPDGQFITFTRYVKGRGAIFKVSSQGGSEVLIAEAGAEADWLPDGRSIVVVNRPGTGRSGLVHHVLETGARRSLTDVADPLTDSAPSVSPDGTEVAFMRYTNNRSAVFVVPLSGGEARRLGDWYSGVIGGLEWTPDGREIVLARPENSGRRLVRQPVAANGPALPVLNIPHNSISPSFSGPRPGNTQRLAFVSGLVDVGLRLVDLQAPQQAGTIVAHAPFCDATRMDSPGRFSPDGSQVAFVSDRSGSQQIWVANRDGSALRSVTNLQDASVSLGSWSPDGRLLAYDATVGETTHIYAVPVNGGPAKRLTQSASGEIDPEWSRDGRWIYFASNQSGRWAIWKVPATGGASTQLASEVGFDPHESPDGRSVFFIDRPRFFGLGSATPLKRVSADGGQVETLDVAVMPGAWGVTEDGIVFIFVAGLGGAIDFARAPDELKLYRFADGRVRTLGTFGFRVGPYGASRFLTVSRDGLWAVASHVDRWDRDIFVLDKFR